MEKDTLRKIESIRKKNLKTNHLLSLFFFYTIPLKIAMKKYEKWSAHNESAIF